MKYLLFGIALVAGVPAMVLLMRFRAAFVKLFMVLFFVMTLNDPSGFQSINFLSREAYRGSSRGMEVTAIDLLALALLIHVLTHRPRDFPRRWGSVEMWAFGAYMLICLLTIATAYKSLYAFFEFWKFLRGAMVFVLFTQLIDRGERLNFLTDVFALMILYQVPFVVQQKYLLGIYRATGTLPHMNTLAMIMNLMAIPVLASFLLREGDQPKWHLLAVAGAVFNVLATASRGALVSMGAGFALCFLFLRRRHLTVRRTTLLSVMALGALIAGIKASDTVIQRFLEAPKESGETRDSLNVCAELMADDHFLGVGLNNYSYAVGHTRYGDPAPDLAEGGKDDGVAHHIYWLNAAEIGYLGLAVFIVFIGSIQLRSLCLIFRPAREAAFRAFGVGCFAGLASLHLQGFLEWILRQTNVWFLFCAVSGSLVAADRLAVEYWRHRGGRADLARARAAGAPDPECQVTLPRESGGERWERHAGPV